MQDRRKSAHTRVFKGGKLVFGNGAVIDCIVRSVTNAGARIKIANTVELPEDLGLTLDKGYSVRSCRIVWRTVTETGIEFV